jgi:hypothetical protein
MRIRIAPLSANRQMEPASGNSSQPLKEATPPSPFPILPTKFQLSDLPVSDKS